MAFYGELEHLPLVDIVQLLYSTRKSGILSVKGEKGESRLVFSEGNIVSANYLNGQVRIGRVLEKMGFLAPGDLDIGLEAQKNAGENRKPLIATLIALGKLKKEQAQQGLRKLVELTVVELVGWTSGSFALETEAIPVSDQVLYSPDKMEQEILLDSQMVLMDALRIYDEKNRDGTSKELVFSYEELAAEAPPPEEESGKGGDGGGGLTADDLGLADIDKVEREIPRVFMGLKHVDPADAHRQVVRGALRDWAEEQQEDLVTFLSKFSGSGPEVAVTQGRARGIVFFSGDELIKHSIMTVCKQEGALVFSTGDEEDLVPVIDRYHSKEIRPLLVFDAPGGAGGGLSDDEVQSLRRRVRDAYPYLPVVQFVSREDHAFSWQSYGERVRAVIPKPLRDAGNPIYVEEIIDFLGCFRSYAREFFQEQESHDLGGLKVFMRNLHELGGPADISLALLEYVAAFVERAMTFVVRKDELIAERSIGIKGGKAAGPSPALKFIIPLAGDSLLSRTVKEGSVFFGESEDDSLDVYLFSEIGTPRSRRILLLPLKSGNQTVALTYGDFGRKEDVPLSIDALAMAAEQAGLVVDSLRSRKRP